MFCLPSINTQLLYNKSYGYLTCKILLKHALLTGNSLFKSRQKIWIITDLHLIWMNIQYHKLQATCEANLKNKVFGTKMVRQHMYNEF